MTPLGLRRPSSSASLNMRSRTFSSRNILRPSSKPLVPVKQEQEQEQQQYQQQHQQQQQQQQQQKPQQQQKLASSIVTAIIENPDRELVARDVSLVLNYLSVQMVSPDPLKLLVNLQALQILLRRPSPRALLIKRHPSVLRLITSSIVDPMNSKSILIVACNCYTNLSHSNPPAPPPSFVRQVLSTLLNVRGNSKVTQSLLGVLQGLSSKNRGGSSLWSYLISEHSDEDYAPPSRFCTDIFSFFLDVIEKSKVSVCFRSSCCAV